jgi:3'(2'), 5'-bisphosphate nucleotidase
MTTTHPSHDLSSLLPEIVRIAEAAGEEILRIYENHDVEVRRKAGGDPLTEADLAAETLIRRELALLGDIPIVSEETEAAPFATRRAWRELWLVDPLDGTKEFIARNGEFTVNIALIRDGRPVLGVVGAPALNRIYWAAEGIGAFVRRGGVAPARITVREAQDAPVIVVSRSHAGNALTAFLERFGPHTLLPMGSSLKFCLVAEGAAQLYPRLGPTYEWDIAAAHCIVEQAGGHMTDIHGNTLVYNKENLLNPWCIAGVRSDIVAPSTTSFCES